MMITNWVSMNRGCGVDVGEQTGEFEGKKKRSCRSDMIGMKRERRERLRERERRKGGKSERGKERQRGGKGRTK